MSACGTVHTYTSDENRRFEYAEDAFRPDANGEFGLIRVHPAVGFQHVVGFGGAFTESTGSVYAGMSQDDQRAFIDGYFDDDQRGCTLCRTPIQSCDFSLDSYAYDKHRFDDALKRFSVQRDERYIIPLIQDALAACPDMELLASPWSPPAYMKTNHSMRLGGHLKPRYRRRWARMMARYARVYRDRGFPVVRMTLQNEPRARQTWESCLMDGAEEAVLAGMLREELDACGLDDVKLLAWDHNKERILDRMDELSSDGEPPQAIDGIGFHWYTGDHFEELREAVRRWGDCEFIMTEGCAEYSRGFQSEISHAEHYAHDIIGDLEAGVHGWIDWNMLLDEAGGPNHAGNFCSAPVRYDCEQQKLEFLASYYYIAHFRRYIRPGAQRVLTSRFSDAVEATSFCNRDGSMVCVLLNRTDEAHSFELYVEGEALHQELPAHSIRTVCWAGQAV